MRSLERLFTRYGNPSREMREQIYIYGTRADCIEDLQYVKETDKRIEQTISELQEYIELLKEYRNALFQRAQEFLTAEYTMQLVLKRNFHSYKGNIFYTVEVLKILKLKNAAPVAVISEQYEGKERRKALKRFEELKKQYPGIEVIKDVDKKSWEK